jgi:hypothetical protein
VSKRSKRVKRVKRLKEQQRKARRVSRRSGADMIVVPNKLTVKQCADDAGVSTTLVYTWINKDRVLKAENLGGHATRIALEEWLRFKTERGLRAPANKAV